ncbi:FUSC family protein [Streptomyces caniferus]|uniref:FUSC family protein n=1 Tax=Streptomyces caniferus TaxID=285557 RepID=UPI002E284A27|nr:FUSC family protein [Streptomyces caniferus]
MGKHAKPSGKSAPAVPGSGVRVRPLPIRSSVRLRRPVDIWHKPALSAVAALAIPDLTLFGMGRLDLVLYTSAGAMCALYAHGLPYAARARTLLWVVFGMVASLGIALTAASLTTSTALLVVLASLMAAVHKMVCDATRIGPPGNIILTFITASAFFVPQHLGEVPLHLALALGAGGLAWLVCMAPALIRPHGPERIAAARALEAAAGLLRTEAGSRGVEAPGGEAAGIEAARVESARVESARVELAGAAPVAVQPAGVEPARVESVGVAQARHATAAAVNAAWHTLFLVPARTPARAAARAGLERLLVRAESALGHDGRTAAGEAERLGTWARELRSGRPLPQVVLSAEQAEELMGVAEEARGPRRPAPGRPHGVRAVLARLAPGSPLLPIGARVAAGCVLAGWVSMAVGVGHPYWAVVTAASIFQANTTLSWQRALQRTLGNLLGLLLYTALLPLMHVGELAMIALALTFQLGAEACITRNYWLGSVCVTPMALLLTEFGRRVPAGSLIADRWIDTVVGAVVGLACCVLVTNRRAANRIEVALGRVAAAEAVALRLLAARNAPGTDGAREARSAQETEWALEAGATQEPEWALESRATQESAWPHVTAWAQETGWARDRLAGCLVELREAVDVAAGEWWQRALPEERIARAEQQGHRALAGLVRQLPAAVPAPVPVA